MVNGGEGLFPTTKRVKRRTDFQRIYRDGEAIEGMYFTFHILPRVGSNRLGISISRGWGTAVERNRIKRLIREAFRRHDEVFSDMDTIVRPHEVCKGHRAKEIEDSLIGEFRAAVRMEVEHGKRDSVPDERGIRPDEAGV